MGTVVHGDAHHVDILLRRHGGDGLGGLAEPRVDHLAAGITQDARYDTQASIVPVEADLGDEDAQRPVGLSMRCSRRFLRSLRRRSHRWP